MHERQEQDDMFVAEDGTGRSGSPVRGDTDKQAPDDRRHTIAEKQEASVEGPLDAEALFESWKGDLEQFYDTMRKYYRGEEWTVLRIYEHSPEIRSLIDTLRNVLEQGGVTVHGEQDRLFNQLMAEARQAKGARDFWVSISQRKAMAPKTPCAEFYDAIAKGTNAQQERLSMAA